MKQEAHWQQRGHFRSESRPRSRLRTAAINRCKPPPIQAPKYCKIRTKCRRRTFLLDKREFMCLGLESDVGPSSRQFESNRSPFFQTFQFVHLLPVETIFFIPILPHPQKFLSMYIKNFYTRSITQCTTLDNALHVETTSISSNSTPPPSASCLRFLLLRVSPSPPSFPSTFIIFWPFAVVAVMGVIGAM